MKKLKKYSFLILSICLLFSCSSEIVFNNPFDNYTVVEVGFGPEDFQLDTLEGNRLLISCDERREKLTQGSIWEYDLDTKEPRQVNMEPELDFDFHPHGLFLLQEDSTTYLFVINHVDEETSEIDRFIVLRDKLVLDERFTEIIGSPNDIFAIAKDEFYYTDYQTFTGSIVHYDSTAKKIIKGLYMPNGIYVEDDVLYFTTTLLGNVFKADLGNYDKEKLGKIPGGDNIMDYTPDAFLITAHPNFNKFLGHAKDPEKISPSLVYSIDKNTGEKEIVFYDDGEKISAVSTAFFYEEKLYLAQVFDNFILICE